MKIAVIGAGISGLAAAYYLSRSHEVTVLESADCIGGHTATIDIEYRGQSFAVDTGFIVYNDWTYPKFIRLLTELNIDARPAEMSFSVSCGTSGLEYAGSNLNTLFAQRKNLVSPAYWRMLWEILRFNREAILDLDAGRISADETLGSYLSARGYGNMFIEKYLVPMGAAIWSASTEEMRTFPVLFFVRFFKNHGLLSVKNRPQWYTLVGGSRSYLEPLTAAYNDNIVLGATVQRIERTAQNVTVTYHSADRGFTETSFDALVIATHSDQALALLSDATADEKSILGSIPYQNNDVVLHIDESLLPSRKLAWSSWNYRLARNGVDETAARLTYNMNILQGLDAPCTFCVSLNQTDQIDPDKIVGRYQYSHPVFNLEGIRAQHRWSDIAGNRRTWFCGAYWGYGFHEDGVSSALRVVDSISNADISERRNSVHQSAGVA